MKNSGIPFFSTKTAVATPPALSDRRAAVRPELKRMVVRLNVKADAIDEEARTFEGLASVWGPDLGDDVMHKGAFKKTILEWKGEDGEAIPLLNSHNHWDVLGAVGQLIDAKETADGLWTKWEIIPGPDGDRILDRIRPGSNGRSPVGKMSIGYEPMKFDFEQSESARFGRLRNLREVKLKEVSLVLFPMAPGASIDSSSVKSFLESATEAKPEDMDDETKGQLRKLATRIGVLLSGKKGASSETAEPPAKPATTKTPTAPAPAAAESQSTEVEATASGETGEGGEEVVEESSTEGKYRYPEALATRIQSVTKKAAATQS